MNGMDKIPGIADIIASYSSQDKTLEESAADPGATILEVGQEKVLSGEHARRMTELKKVAELQKKVVHRLLGRAVEDLNQPKKPHLTVVN
jgi:hypothetical protein